MKIPEIERALADSDPKVRLYICKLQEQILALSQQNDEVVKIVIMVVQTLENVQKINVELSQRWQQRLDRDGGQEGMVESVMNEPEN